MSIFLNLVDKVCINKGNMNASVQCKIKCFPIYHENWVLLLEHVFLNFIFFCCFLHLENIVLRRQNKKLAKTKRLVQAILKEHNLFFQKTLASEFAWGIDLKKSIKHQFLSKTKFLSFKLKFDFLGDPKNTKQKRFTGKSPWRKYLKIL